jgi:hypothetical protein
MTPTGSKTGARNSQLLYQLQCFAKSSGGCSGFDSSAGFRLPDVSVLSPDDEGPRGLRALRGKLASYQANGASAGCCCPSSGPWRGGASAAHPTATRSHNTWRPVRISRHQAQPARYLGSLKARQLIQLLSPEPASAAELRSKLRFGNGNGAGTAFSPATGPSPGAYRLQRAQAAPWPRRPARRTVGDRRDVSVHGVRTRICFSPIGCRYFRSAPNGNWCSSRSSMSSTRVCSAASGPPAP